MSEPVGNRGWIGRTLEGRYEVLDVIGEGGMGAVFKARHLLLDKEVALKVVHPGLADNHELSARFAREAAVTSRLDHPNVISVSDSGLLEDGSAYIAMQFVRGPSLTHVLETEGALHWTRVASLGAQLADALSAAHGHGIVHRDLKPDNILLQDLGGGRELVKVLDFGIARFTRESLAPPTMRGAKHNLTQTGLVVGTPGYMSPEQAMGEPADFRSDLYALGVILWECLTGQRLWPGEDIPTIVERQLVSQVPSPRLMAGDEAIPEALDALVLRLLSRRGADRPQSPAVVKDVLESLGADISFSLSTPRTGKQPSQAFRQAADSVGLLPTALDSSRTDNQQRQPTPAPAAQQPPPRRTMRPRSRTAGLFALLLLTVLGAGAVLVWTGVVEVRATDELNDMAGQLGVKVPERLQRAMDAIAGPEEEGDEGPAPDLGVPAELEPQLVLLMSGETRSERVAAARHLLAHIPMEEVDAYIRGVAHMQLAETCQAKASRLDMIVKLGDPRALPALHRLASRPRRGCGKQGRRDCLACLRNELGAAIKDLETKQFESDAL